MEKINKEIVCIGVIVGAGTGDRLAQIFKSFLSALAEKHTQKQVVFAEDLGEDGRPNVYHSYRSLADFAGGNAKLFDRTSKKEAKRLFELTQKWYKDGVRVVFRTSINAEALYRFRQKVRAVKVFGLELHNGSRILFVRDQAEGFYANTAYSIGKKNSSIHFGGQYTRHHQKEVFRYALKAAQKFMGNSVFEKWAIYKHHLFADLFERWMKSVDKDIQPFQPDNGLSELYNIVVSGQSISALLRNVLVVCSNEVGDMVYEAILGVINIEPKLELYSRNIYCSPPFLTNFVEYQTVHGSADDIAATDDVVPYATLRIAADIAEEYLGMEGIKHRLEMAISEAKRNKLKTTTNILNGIFSYFKLD